MSEEVDPRFRHDAATIERGQAHIAEIRARLRHSSGPAMSGRVTQPEPEYAEREGAGEWSPDRINAELAVAAERDELVERVRLLEQEVARLRAALAGVLEAAAGGLRSDQLDE